MLDSTVKLAARKRDEAATRLIMLALGSVMLALGVLFGSVAAFEADYTLVAASAGGTRVERSRLRASGRARPWVSRRSPRRAMSGRRSQTSCSSP